MQDCLTDRDPRKSAVTFNQTVIDVATAARSVRMESGKNMAAHNIVNSRCTKCGCRTWEQAKQCVTPAKRTRRPRQERESQTSQHCDAGWMNDARFGGSND